MNRPILFLMLGFPGAGKTTVSRILHKLTGATHVWADHERRKRIKSPTYTHQENVELYSQLNKEVEELLLEGKSVVFDTNFNFYKDRQKLRAIAERAGVQTVVVWLTTDKSLARQRATEHDLEGDHTRVLGNMPVSHFERIAKNLQKPRPDERVITFDGSNHITEDDVAKALQTL